MNYYDQQDYEKALEIFETNADTSKIYFNIGMIHATRGFHDKAVSDESGGGGYSERGAQGERHDH